MDLRFSCPVRCMGITYGCAAFADDLQMVFSPVRVPEEKEKADIATSKVNAIVQAHSEGIISTQIALKELSELSDEDIKDADNMPDIGDIPTDTPTDIPENTPDEEFADDADFDENKHPQREDGKFGAKGESPDGKLPKSPNEQLTNEENSGKLKSYQKISAIGKNTFLKGFSKRNLNRHWDGDSKHHGHKDMYPEMTKEQYAKRALDLVQSETNEHILGYATKAGAVARYDVRTNDFAKGDPNGGIATMFKPTLGKKYFDKWKKREGI